MKEKKTIYLLNEADIEKKIAISMEDLEMDDTSNLLRDVNLEDIYVDRKYIQEIQERTAKKVELEDLATRISENNEDAKNRTKTDGTKLESTKAERPKTERTKTDKIKHSKWIRYFVVASAIVLCIITVTNRQNIGYAFNNMLSLIPGIGITADNQEAAYCLKEPVLVKNDLSTLKILYVTATKDSMVVRFDLDGIFTEEQMSANKKFALENKNSISTYKSPTFYILSGSKKSQQGRGGSGSGLSGYSYSISNNFTFDMGENYINSSKSFTLVSEDYNIRAEFQLVALEQYSSPSEIGATETHNEIGLTATAFLKDDELSVNVYPMNNSKYNLLSFKEDYNFNYLGKKMTLNTDKGEKEYSPPNYYGTDMNAPITFDVSDGASDFVLSIPFVVVETNEEEEITLPIPKEEEVIEVNEEVVFENGIVIIKSVEKEAGYGDEKYGYLKINLEYKSLDDNQQLVGAELTGIGAACWYPVYDDQKRLKYTRYVLEKSDTSELKLSVTKPRYVLLDQYNLVINVK